ncbi:hypothetical protein AAKU55_005232 [Oxalobacteraceae bacterium GrIS 1.11]
MKRNTLLAAAAAAALALGAGGAMANDLSVNAGLIPVAPNDFFYLFNHNAGTFADTVTFSLGDGTLNSVANPLTLSFDGMVISHISNLDYSLLMGSTKLANFVGDNTDFATALLAGNYSLTIKGKADGFNGGAYGMGLQVAAVPEPEMYLTLLIGLGLIGFLPRRPVESGDEKFA